MRNSIFLVPRIPKAISKTENNKKDMLESTIKIITTLIAVAGVVIGVIQFQVQQRHNDSHEFKLKIWERRLTEYNKISEVSGKLIVYIENKKLADSLSVKFGELYYSSMPVVQDSMVEKQMIEFNLALKDYNRKLRDLTFLKKKQLRLMKALGASIKRINDLVEDEQ